MLQPLTLRNLWVMFVNGLFFGLGFILADNLLRVVATLFGVAV